MSIRPAHDADLAAIIGVEQHGFAATERWSEASWRAELAADNRVVLIDQDAAVIAIQIVGPVSDLNRVVVAPDARRRGLGRELVAEAMRVAREAGCEEMLLEVRADNAPARALYAELGFAEIARRHGYYGDGHDALILRADMILDADSREETTNE